jgi:hypothetical protein
LLMEELNWRIVISITPTETSEIKINIKISLSAAVVYLKQFIFLIQNLKIEFFVKKLRQMLNFGDISELY